MKGKYRNIFLLLVAVVAGFQAGYIYFNTSQVEGVQEVVKEPVEKERTVRVVRSNQSIGETYHQIFREKRDSVVYISSLKTSEESESQVARGSGFFYDSKGHIVTNSHVIDKGDAYEVTLLNGTSYRAELVGQDEYTDLAVLKIDADRPINPLELGKSSKLKVGYSVLAIGNPFGLRGSMTSGIVSQKDRLLPATGGFSIQNVIQTDAAINPGNSGGPLLNAEGDLIGVNTAIDTRTRTFSGVGFAIPVSMVKKVVPTLIESGEYKHPWIGVSGTDVTPPVADALGLEENSGFLVSEVVEGSPADKAGIQEGNREINIRGRDVKVGGDIIVGINGREVRQINDILDYLFHKTTVGERVTLTVIRNGQKMNVELTLVKRPTPG